MQQSIRCPLRLFLPISPSDRALPLSDGHCHSAAHGVHAVASKQMLLL